MRFIAPCAVLVLVSLCWNGVESKTVFRRTDKISENFKQLDLPPEEIDPNVAPPEPQKVETLDPEDVVSSAAETEENVSSAVAQEVSNALTSADESANEIPSVEVAAAAPAAPAEPAAASTAAAVTPKPTKAPAKPSTDDDKNPISRYCKCSESHCDCCRKFGLPLIPSGPGCAKISYLGNDEMSVSIKYGDITLASRRISSKKARPICVGLPGGYSKFCGRVYGLSRAKENFKACLAFELRAEDEVEAALRVSCFKFGPEGLRVAEAEPLPTEVNKGEEDEDDDDIFGFAAGGGDDDEDEEDYDADEPEEAEDDDTEDYNEAEDDDTDVPEDADYGGFSLGGLLDELDDDDDEKPAKKPAAGAAATGVVITPAADQTREHVDATKQTGAAQDLPQSKDEAGTVAAAPVEAAAAAAEVAAEEAVAAAVTPAPAAAAAAEATTAKSKKSKKAKKNKKKKAASGTGEGDFAYELLNGILDFFN